jgi:hypothetical protein
MRKSTLSGVLALLLYLSNGNAIAAGDDLQFDIPVRFATLDADASQAESGSSLLISDLADADKQISSILLQALQTLGFAIESPKLDLNTFLAQDQQWRSTAVQLSPKDVHDYNNFAQTPQPLPPDRIYAVRYSGRYQFVSSALRMILSISLQERSQLGPLRDVSFSYSQRFFVMRLEDSVKAQVAKQNKP